MQIASYIIKTYNKKKKCSSALSLNYTTTLSNWRKRGCYGDSGEQKPGSLLAAGTSNIYVLSVVNEYYRWCSYFMQYNVKLCLPNGLGDQPQAPSTAYFAHPPSFSTICWVPPGASLAFI